MSAAPPSPPAAAELRTELEPHGGGKENLLTGLIFAGIVLALLLAWAAPEVAASFAVGGQVFLSVLKMLVVPLVVTSVVCGVLSMGDVRKLGRPGAATLIYYFCTTAIAVVTGIILVNLFNPGAGIDGAAARDVARAEVSAKLGEQAVSEPAGVGAIFENLLTMLFTDNLLESAAETDLLPLIVFSLAFAAVLTTMGAAVGTVTKFVTEANDVLMKFVLLVMWTAPLGVFCLVAGQFGEAAADGDFAGEMAKVGWYSATVLTGLAVHAFVTLPLILWLLTRRNPYQFLFQMSRPLLTAFATASSSATLPVTMETAVEKAGIKRKSVDFVLPLGATVNMDGTALYEAVAALFIAQTLVGSADAIDMGLTTQIIVAATATLAAIGAAGIPQAGLFTLIIVLNAVGLPVELAGLILSVDWLLDRFRTAVNVFGDATGAAVVEKFLPPEPVPTAAGTVFA
ncbi:dicarboxylate/amino acid:cation symporter [Alienimonas californiensis]|uniref:Proton/sodium-glutamate symport protein n=1 Tax=Alienimonas californiensis TaxID=2527989 RepID=A0A517P8Z2_9PLAN|nr:dicarboxylate/amino acid:cation symporter [Alienimonas californiensis]QDT15846.1 Proton/sodium-glutamate symport protein [Alienimonas californiensis]